MRFANEHPTQAEKVMFEYQGLYLIQKTETSYHYAPVHLEQGYSYLPTLDVEEDAVEWDNVIIFDTFSETVTMHGDYDSISLKLIFQRMKELHWNI